MGKRIYSYNIEYVNHNDFVIWSKNYPKHWVATDSIYDEDNASFDVYYFRPKKEAMKMFTESMEEGILKSWNDDREAFLKKYPQFSEEYVESMIKTRGISGLFDSNRLKKSFEKHLKKMLKAVDDGEMDDVEWPFIDYNKTQYFNKKKFFDFSVMKNKYMSISDFEIAFGEFENEVDSIKKYKHNKWNIIVESKVGFNEDEVMIFLDKVERGLSKKSFNKVCYGKVVMVKKIPGKAIGHYYRMGDSVELQTQGLSGGKPQLLNMYHELGHRYWYFFLGNKVKQKIEEKFKTLTNKVKFKVQKGDMIKHIQTGDVYIYKGRAGGRRRQFIAEVVKHRTIDKGTDVEINTKYLSEKVFEIKGIRRTSLDKYFPTPYSKKDVDEWFCELFAFYTADALDDVVARWLESVIK